MELEIELKTKGIIKKTAILKYYNRFAFIVKGDILVYKNEIVVKIKLKVLFNKSGKMNLKIFNLCNEDVFF